jgi:hypothetical protein
MIDDDEPALRRAQDKAIARAHKRLQPTAYPGGLLARVLAERSLAETLRRRHDAPSWFFAKVLNRITLANGWSGTHQR